MWFPRDETDNFQQKHDVELIKEEKRNEVETEIRIQVDELMREELKNLKLVPETSPNDICILHDEFYLRYIVLWRCRLWTATRERRERRRRRGRKERRGRARKARRRRT